MKRSALYIFGLFIGLLAALPSLMAVTAHHALAAGAMILHAAIPGAAPLVLCATNTIDAGLKVDVILDTFLEAFVEELLPIGAFATNFSSDVIDEGDKVKVGYVPAAAAARAFKGSYTTQASDWQKKEVVIDQHEYVSWGLSDVDLFKGSLVNLQMQTRMKAHALASAVLTNILGLVTAENYPDLAFTGVAAGFDLDDVADIRTLARKAHWPKAMRNLVLSADYYGNVVKGNTWQDAAAAGSSSVRETGELPRLYTFTPYESESIPDNGENLTGFANMPSAMAVAMRYLKPRRPEKYIDARPVSDPKTGITYGFRQDYDTKTGEESYIFECNWGRSVLESAALKRIRSGA